MQSNVNLKRIINNFSKSIRWS